MTHVIHPFAPVFDAQSRVLILGSLPSPKSREFGFYYGHPQNVFWSTLAKVLQVAEPDKTPAAREAFLHEHHVALYDVVIEADIQGAQDATIVNPVVADLAPILASAPIERIFVEGRKAEQLYAQFILPKLALPATYLPSTSPANRFTQQKPSYWESWQQVAQVFQ
ncbi:MAG TPA: DNA-deoxyinosine glycosylase [Lactobacillaceae bacterium]|jgi:hypoxanthine-DNA glycosylase